MIRLAKKTEINRN